MLVIDSMRFGSGLYIMAPLPNDEHQDIQTAFAAALKDALGWESPAKVRAGVNVSDRAEDWVQNFRCPDVVVYLPGNPAINHGTHWQGGPDFLVEVVSDQDRSTRKNSPSTQALASGKPFSSIASRGRWNCTAEHLPVRSSNLPARRRLRMTSCKVKFCRFRFRLVPTAFRPKLVIISAATTSDSKRSWTV